MCVLRTGLLAAYFLATLIQGSLQVEFEEAPLEATSVEGSAVLIRCNTKTSVVACQWYWLSLSADVASQPVVVSSFPAYGADNRSCSVRFKAVRDAQQGLWICGVQEAESDVDYVLGPQFKLSVVPPEASTVAVPSTTRAQVVEFAEMSKDHAVKVGMPMHLICKTTEAVDECLWSWRASETEPEIPVRKIEPFGEQRLNCDIRFDHVLSHHDGIWTCGAKFHAQAEFSRAHPIHVTIRTEVGFVQLSQDIQVSLGEPVLLRCITNTAVDQCQWVWHGLNKNNDSVDVLKRFPAYGDERRDCSVRFRSVLQEHAGEWTCQARLEPDSEFNSAPSAKLTVLYPAQAAFTEDPQDIAALLGDPVTLKCVTTAPTSECSWTWRPEHDNYTQPLLVKRFPPFDNASRNCSVRFKAVFNEQQGIWGCQVRDPDTNNTLASRLARLTVYEKGSVTFEQLTQEILIYPGGPLALRCTTSLRVDLCRWTWQPFDKSLFPKPVIFRQFTPVDEAGRDCTIRLWNVKREQKGLWICGIKQHNETNFTLAAPTSVKIMQPESVTVALWTSPESTVSLACRLSTPQLEAACRWFHPPRVNVSEHNHTKGYSVQHTKSSGVCTLTFSPGPQDLGQWTCSFSVNTEAGEWEMASANLILLTTSTPGFNVSEDKLGWLIGVLAVMVLVLTATLVALSLCKCRDPAASQDTSGLTGPAASASAASLEHTRYTDSPTKIDFQFGVPTAAAAAAAAAAATRSVAELRDVDVVMASHDTDQQHIYEKVGRYITPLVESKSIYENVE